MGTDSYVEPLSPLDGALVCQTDLNVIQLPVEHFPLGDSTSLKYTSCLHLLAFARVEQ
jgi:hypothetical protein